ncbi:MAG TPA: 3-phosphoshikimate 1-carboxyvinyltransferase, partial [Thermoanaerobaculia bacterium]|nr:3-phosphoshikimate 1-carboxyvinyltransferase [Thermoanaerobaculia bacterium]
LKGVDVPAERAPSMIDEYPILAVAAAYAEGTTRMRGLKELRVKESDRLATVTSELRRLGATVEERPDSLLIRPGWNDTPAVIETHNDHRIAMAFAIAGLARGNVTIGKEQVVTKSYPRFWRTLDEVVAAIN